ncbi:MAG: potassium channel protein [Lentisphaerae bacterium]|nr:potassium channel protein [Lentisphaerota bacterium]
MNIKKRLFQVLSAIFLVVMIGSCGYYLLYNGEPRFMDCVYMTVISLTGVGYGEVVQVTGNTAAEIFTIFIIIFGMGIILYGISTLTALLIEGELSGLLRRKRMNRQIEKLKGHYIVCGGGETGHPLVGELVNNREKVVLIEHDYEKIEICKKTIENLLYVKGDATDDQNLITAGIEKASGILICLASDKDNLYVTMSARMINSKIRVISRMIDPRMELKLLKAGADRVVSPNFIGALRMASEIIRPTVVDFLDNMLRSRQGTLRINQIAISDNSGVVGKKISESGIKDKFDMLVLGLKEGDNEIEFNPPASLILKKGMSLIVMGEVDNIKRAKEEF